MKYSWNLDLSHSLSDLELSEITLQDLGPQVLVSRNISYQIQKNSDEKLRDIRSDGQTAPVSYEYFPWWCSGIPLCCWTAHGRGRKIDHKIKEWLIDYLLFYVPIKNISLIWRCHHCRWRAAKFRPMLGAQGLWAGRDLYRVTPAVTRGLGFSGLIRRTAPISRLLRHTRGCGGPILTRILTGE
jgi:hypothetical protein